MPDITIRLTDAQTNSLLSLATDLRHLIDDLRPYFTQKRVLRRRGRQAHPHRVKPDDIWLDVLSIHLEGRDVVSSFELMHDALGLPPERRHSMEARRVAACMRELNWAGPKAIRLDGLVCRGYRRNAPPQTV